MNRTTQLTLLAGLLGSAFATTAAAGTPTTYDDRTTFENVLGTVVTDSYAPADGYPAGFAVYDNATFSAFFGETDYRSTGHNNLNIIDGYGAETYCAGCNGSFELSFTSTSVTEAGGAGVLGVGIDIAGNVGTYVAFVTYGDGTTENLPLPDIGFWAITAPEFITSIHFGRADGGTRTNGSFGMHDLTIGNDFCGNGIAADEACDDANGIEFDTCSNTCTVNDPNDYDNDGVWNAFDNCPGVANAGQEDADSDGLGDACDSINGLDIDGDGINNDSDNCPFDPNNGQEDADADGLGDACDDGDGLDVDGDDVPNDADNCPFTANAGQEDSDSDGLGNACDDINNDDPDNDGFDNADDNCPFEFNSNQADSDNDGFGDACDNIDGNDLDDDGFDNDNDNCPFNANPGQEDSDGDSIGDACDAATETLDTDEDGLVDADDNCADVANEDQADADGDGLGDACDPLTWTDDGCSIGGGVGGGANAALLLFALVALRRRKR